MSLDAFMKKKFKTMGLDGEWRSHLGDAVKEGSWFIIGKSGNGKTSYATQLGKELAKYGKVAYNSIEEGDSSTLQSALARIDILEVKKRFLTLNKESYLELCARLRKPKSPDIIIIDSLQTFPYDPENTRKFSYTDFRSLLKEFPNKLFVFISKWEPSKPFVLNVKHDSNIKIIVENYYASIETTRYEGGGEMFDVWKDR